VGTLVGLPVGPLVGALVGLEVGPLVGALVGLEVGPVVRLPQRSHAILILYRQTSLSGSQPLHTSLFSCTIV
jgi:hypothetical protein